MTQSYGRGERPLLESHAHQVGESGARLARPVCGDLDCPGHARQLPHPHSSFQHRRRPSRRSASPLLDRNTPQYSSGARYLPRPRRLCKRACPINFGRCRPAAFGQCAPGQSLWPIGHQLRVWLIMLVSAATALGFHPHYYPSSMSTQLARRLP